MSVDDQADEGQRDQAKLNPRRHATLPSPHSISLSPLETARSPMKLVCVMVGGFALLSLGCFSYQFYYRLAHGDEFIGTQVQWSGMFGHLIRGVGLGLVCWRLAEYARSNEGDSVLARRHTTFWRTTAWVAALLGIYAVIVVAYNRSREAEEKEALFRPEFRSGRVSFRVDRIEFRQASTEPVDGFIKMKMQNSEEHFF